MYRSGILIVLFLFVFAGSGQAETKKQRDQREAVEKQLELKYREVVQKVESLKVRNVREESRKKMDRLGEELAVKLAMAGRKLPELRSSRSDEWDRLKAETNAAIEDVDRVYTSMSSLLR